eukprot:1159622-Pelagomonas_calceolata.AAC.4
MKGAGEWSVAVGELGWDLRDWLPVAACGGGTAGDSAGAVGDEHCGIPNGIGLRGAGSWWGGPAQVCTAVWLT